MDQDRILTYPRFNGTLARWLLLLDSSKYLNTNNWLKKHLTKNTKNLILWRRPVACSIMPKDIVQVTPEVVSATQILSISTVKRLALEQRRFLRKRE